MRLRTLVFLLAAACRATPSTESEVPVCTTATDVFRAGPLVSAWVSPSGEVVAGGPDGVSWRSVEGVWSTEDGPSGVRVLSGHGDTVWIGSTHGVWRRQGEGPWEEAEWQRGVPEGLAALAEDDVRVVDALPLATESNLARVEVHRWDGVAWHPQAHVQMNGASHATFLADGRAAVVAYGELWIEGGDVQALPAELIYAHHVSAAPDGTLVLLVGDGPIGIGDGAGITVTSPPVDAYWLTALALAADDVWVAGTESVFEGGPATIIHWDGAEWSVVAGLPDVYPRDLVELADGSVLAVGGITGRTAARGGPDGFVVEEDSRALSSIQRLAVDDVTGEAWALGYRSAAVSTGGPWVVQDVGIDIGFIPQIAVSAGRLAQVMDEGGVEVREPDGTVWRDPFDGSSITEICGADGVLFVAGRSGDQPAAWRATGAEWSRIDLGVQPQYAGVSGCWADGPESLWLGLFGSDGELLSWDGATATTVVRADGNIGWLRRLEDGRLWMAVDRALWSWNGSTLAPEVELDGPTVQAHLTPDGTLFVPRGFTPDDDRWVLLERPPGGELTEVFGASGAIALAGLGDQVWAAGETEDELGVQAWRRSCEP